MKACLFLPWLAMSDICTGNTICEGFHTDE